MRDSKKLTTAFGIQVDDDQNTMTAGNRGPVSYARRSPSQKAFSFRP
jgi:catalase